MPTLPNTEKWNNPARNSGVGAITEIVLRTGRQLCPGYNGSGPAQFAQPVPDFGNDLEGVQAGPMIEDLPGDHEFISLGARNELAQPSLDSLRGPRH